MVDRKWNAGPDQSVRYTLGDGQESKKMWILRYVNDGVFAIIEAREKIDPKSGPKSHRNTLNIAPERALKDLGKESGSDSVHD